MSEVQRQHAENQFAHELEALAKADTKQKTTHVETLAVGGLNVLNGWQTREWG